MVLSDPSQSSFRRFQLSFLCALESLVGEGLQSLQCSGRDAAMTHVHSLPAEWLPVSIAPIDADLEVCVMDKHGIHVLVSPCRKDGTGWVDASNRKYVDIQPTHWRKWTDNR